MKNSKYIIDFKHDKYWPFYDVKYRFGRVMLTINSAHPFFNELYEPLQKLGADEQGADVDHAVPGREHQPRPLMALDLEVLRQRLTKEDVVAVGYRKGQLRVFERLLNDEAYFRQKAEEKKCTDEALWQVFFERNAWIFGYGLSYVYLTGLDNKKLEQVVAGYSVAQAGKRTDALLRTRGVLSSLCFVEIKRHTTPLLEAMPYRSACWAPSRELAGAVSQVQGTVAQAA